MSSATTGHMALDSDPLRFVILSELLAKTDPATLATAIYTVANTNRYTDADKVLVGELSKYKGEHATGAALEMAHPALSVQSDAWAQVEETDTIWIIDANANPVAWKNSNSSVAPADVDMALSKASTNAVSNQVISAAIENRLVYQVFPLPGDGTVTSFNLTHTLSNVATKHVQKRGTQEEIAIKVVKSSGAVITVGPFATPPADSSVFELVLTGTVAL